MYIFCCPNPEVLERDGDLNNKMQIMPYVAIQFFGRKFYNGGTIQEVMDCGLEKMRGRERDAIRTF